MSIKHTVRSGLLLLPGFASGAPFVLENKELFNGKSCNGDTVAVPDGGDDMLFVLAAAATDCKHAAGSFKAGQNTTDISVPSYTGFIGQRGHTGHTEGCLKDDEVTSVGTHRHSHPGDHPYEYTYK